MALFGRRRAPILPTVDTSQERRALGSGVLSGNNINVSKNNFAGIDFGGVNPSSLPDVGVGDYAKSVASVLGGFGAGPLSIAMTAGKYAMNPSMFADTRQVNIPGIGTIATSPGPIGPMLDIGTPFGVLARTMGALNARNLANVISKDPNASVVGGKGWGGAFSNGTFNGTLPGGLEASQRRGIISDIAKQHYDRERERNNKGGNGGYGSGAQKGKPDTAGATRGGEKANPGNTHF